MSDNKKINYWLFQSNPNRFQLKEILRADALVSFPIHAHRKKINVGDKVILWQTGKQAACYGLATVSSPVGAFELTEAEKTFYNANWKTSYRVKLNIDYNLSNKPLTKELIPNSKIFKRFYAGLSGTNYVASKAQYESLKNLVQQLDIVSEAAVEYLPRQSKNQPLNRILYGPPGTGKTYHAVNYALSIIEKRTLEELALEERSALKKRFEEYKEEGQIQFVSFHQSYTYEDFVEGIKPYSHQGKLTYVVEEGIFKHACIEAKRSLIEALIKHLPLEVIAIDFNELYQSFLKYLRSDDFNNFQTSKERKIFLHKILKFGNISVRLDKSFAIENITKNRLRKMYKNFSNLTEIDEAGNAVRHLLGAVNSTIYSAVFNELKKHETQYLHDLTNNKDELELDQKELEMIELDAISENVLDLCCKHVLIIDEINRGNIASIFGELITLLDEDKREGMPEAISVLLPYSKISFSIPPNLHVIATMNTADRSIEALDLALRRRFTFVEMPPQPQLINQLAKTPLALGVDLAAMLSIINQRLSLLLDKDYQIGHSYFLSISNLDDLKAVFKEKIIPLLQEYFFGDFAKIGLVLGKDFVEEENYNPSKIFADFDHEFLSDFADKQTYRIKDISRLEAKDFIHIYDKTF